MRFHDLKVKGLGTGLLGAGLLGFMLGAGGMAVAQQDTHEEGKPQQEEPKKQDEAKPAQPKEQPKEAKPSREQEAPRAEEAKPSKNEKQDEKNGEMRSGQEQNRPAQNDRGMQNNDRGMQNGGGDHARPASGQRIPDDKFRANFGREHHFRVQRTVVGGQPRFQYGGYWFALADPWPGDWAYTDDCYIDYIDGEYVLIDLLHPGVQIALIVVE
jgi:hypothetical protein